MRRCLLLAVLCSAVLCSCRTPPVPAVVRPVTIEHPAVEYSNP